MDRHPMYESRSVARKIAEECRAPVVEVQHHWAHTTSLLVITASTSKRCTRARTTWPDCSTCAGEAAVIQRLRQIGFVDQTTRAVLMRKADGFIQASRSALISS
jgi:ribosomal protein L34E